MAVLVYVAGGSSVWAALVAFDARLRFAFGLPALLLRDDEAGFFGSCGSLLAGVGVSVCGDSGGVATAESADGGDACSVPRVMGGCS